MEMGDIRICLSLCMDKAALVPAERELMAVHDTDAGGVWMAQDFVLGRVKR